METQGGPETSGYLGLVGPDKQRAIELQAEDDDFQWEDLRTALAGSFRRGLSGSPQTRGRCLRTVGTASLALLVVLAGWVHCHRRSGFTARHAIGLWRTSPRFLRLPDGTCADEWQPITNDLACQAAAQELGLPAGALPLKRYTKRPSGCYFVPSSNADSGTLWMNTYSETVGEVFDTAAGWVPETLCARRGVGATTPPPTTTAPGQTVCQYVVGLDGQGTCPAGSVPLNETECRDMPYHFGGMLHMPFAADSPGDPHGCFFFRAHYYYNRNPGGMGRPLRKIYCKHCQSLPMLAQHMGDWSEWGTDSPQTMALARSASSRFRKISVGSCSDIKWFPIRQKAACEEAAKYLALPDIEASVTSFAERPDGCYYFRNYADGTETLWFDANPFSHGNGAETSDLASGGLRQPICSKLPTEGTAAGSGGTLGLDATAATPGVAGPYAADRSMMVVTSPEQKTAPYRKISVGRCMDLNLQPILDTNGCQAASQALGLAPRPVKVVTEPNYPEGCYSFRNTEDLTTTLWLNNSPLSRGNGAQATDAPSGVRQPICAER